ncbi:MAG: NADH-quinone oxidoreductase subunit C [Thermodesulfobacteriota bacterium]
MTTALTNVLDVTKTSLLSEVSTRLPLGYRFVTMTCTDLGEAHELIYHFDKDYVLGHLRLRLAKGEAAPSISMIYAAAVLVENEIKDLFGLPFQGLVLDYEGRFFLSEGAPVAPLGGKAAAPAKGASGATPEGEEQK